MIILNKGERVDWQYGGETQYITDEDIEALRQGRRGFIDVNQEYTVILKYKKTRRPPIDWIPVARGFPKKPYPVLVTIDYGDGHPIVGVARYWASSGWERLTGSEYGSITAWAELPEAYREADND